MSFAFQAKLIAQVTQSFVEQEAAAKRTAEATKQAVAVAKDLVKDARSAVDEIAKADRGVRKIMEDPGIAGYLDRIEEVFELERSGKIQGAQLAKIGRSLALMEQMLRQFDPEFLLSEFKRKSDALAKSKQRDAKTPPPVPASTSGQSLTAAISLGILNK